MAGKTGTAEVDDGTSNQAWFIAFAPADDPKMAIAVTVERTPGQGGTVAAPIAKQVHGGAPWLRWPRSTIVDGRYRVLSRIGSGGMADVYCAEDTHLGRQVALKVLYRRFAQDAEFVERFRREAQSAAGLPHPNVVSVYDRGEHDGTYYIAMEYLPGRTLKEVIAEHGAARPGARDRHRRSRSCAAASFAHRRGVDPPRLQAAQRDGRRRRQREGHGLRHRPRRAPPR